MKMAIVVKEFQGLMRQRVGKQRSEKVLERQEGEVLSPRILYSADRKSELGVSSSIRAPRSREKIGGDNLRILTGESKGSSHASLENRDTGWKRGAGLRCGTTDPSGAGPGFFPRTTAPVVCTAERSAWRVATGLNFAAPFHKMTTQPQQQRC
ncbi:hypothetical protein H920_06927 [Fukomys damarensis]|uniref:Uncharacterized protein n=1 Tax=Fukomys damarensis TaxID=885580 RepID=A0A091DMR9_FUKDA|nr:hypothetical protein H920_06927 [Fukomys damarensis]